MTLTMLLVLLALSSSLVLALQLTPKTYPILALVVSGAEAAIAFDLIQLEVKGVPLPLVLGGALAVLGVLMFMSAGSKWAISAATVVTLVGGIQVLGALNVV